MKADKLFRTNSKGNKVIKKYIINVSILTSVIVLIVANMYNDYMDKFVRDLIAPIFSIDLNNDGEPDLKQLRNYTITFKTAKFPIGNIVYNLIILVIKIIILYYLVQFLFNKLNN